MRLSLNDLLLRICEYNNRKCDAENRKYRVRISVNSDVVKVVVRKYLRDYREDYVNDRGSKRINNALDRKNVGTLLRVGGKIVY